MGRTVLQHLQTKWNCVWVIAGKEQLQQGFQTHRSDGLACLRPSLCQVGEGASAGGDRLGAGAADVTAAIAAAAAVADTQQAHHAVDGPWLLQQSLPY